MFLKKSFSKISGRTQLTIVHGYRDLNGVTKHRTIQSLGYLDELQKQYDNPISHFTKIAKEMDVERLANKYVTVTFDTSEKLNRKETNRKNYGYIVFSKLYHELDMARFMKNARRHKKFRYNTDAIMRLLLFTMLLYPCSKRAAVLRKDQFFDSFDCSLDDIYHSLTHFSQISESLQTHLYEQVAKQYRRETDIVYYDVTNYYFEIDKQDELRRRGACKEHRKDPIVQMGLLLDKQGLPMVYKIYPGNKHDSQTMMPVLTEVKKNFGVKRIIVVADKGLNSSDNIAYNTILGDGYIYSKSIRGGGKELQNWVLDETGYRRFDGSGKVKSRIVPDAVINVTVEQSGKQNTKKPFKITQKQIVYYSEKYAIRAKHKREESVAKAMDMIANPAKYQRTFDYGAASYISNLKVDKETGEMLNVKDVLLLDTHRIKEEEKLDGYYCIITSELDDADEHIIEMYKGLWRIEESFKITKSVLGARPVYLSTPEHINAHFLICFIALLLGRLAELRLNGKYNIDRITETLRKVSCSHITQNVWLFDYADEVLDDLNKVFGFDFGLKVMTLREIKNKLGESKRLDLSQQNVAKKLSSI
jgi:transposase